MTLPLRKIIPVILAALFLAGCTATAPPIEKREVGTIGIAPPTQERMPAPGHSADRQLFDEGIALLRGPSPDPAKARAVFATLVQGHLQSSWRPAAETLIRLIDAAAEASHVTDRKTQLLMEQLMAERARLLQENEQLKKALRELTEKQQTETQSLAQENEQLKKDLQRLKTLEIELEKRERMLR